MAARLISPRYHPLITDVAQWPAAIEALARQHLPRLLELVEAGAILPIQEGTTVRILADHATLVRVEVTTGEATGRRGWLPSAVLRHLRVQERRRAAARAA